MNAPKNYKITLTAASPLFIGSGQSYYKNEYLYDNRTRKISVINQEALLGWIVAKNKTQAFESFMLSNRTDCYLSKFFDEMRIRPENIPGLITYTVDAGVAIKKKGVLMEIKTFIKNADGRPYIPGSSFKGALRTILLTKMLRDSAVNAPLPQIEADKKAAAKIEEKYLHTLKRTNDGANALNSVMSAVAISDSAPLDHTALLLCRKVDLSTGGDEGRLNIARESLRPGAQAELILTLKPEAGSLNAEYIKKAIEEFGHYYRKTYVEKFKTPKEAAENDFTNCIFLGGGSGYFSKNILYPGRDFERALETTASIMHSRYSKHKHDQDRDRGISPHTLKYTEYQEHEGGRIVKGQMGLCRVEMTEIKERA